jgi:hypothetical protein
MTAWLISQDRRNPARDRHVMTAAFQAWRLHQIRLDQSLVRHWLDLATLALQQGDLARAARCQERAVVADERLARRRERLTSQQPKYPTC